jgi:hypothetical protein
MRRIRQWHSLLGVFFTPMLLLFVGTGWYQTFDPERLKTPSEAETVVQKLRVVHTDQFYPTTGVGRPASPRKFKLLVGAMSAAVVATMLLGLVLAFRFARDWRVPAAAFFLGVAVPVALLWLAHP